MAIIGAGNVGKAIARAATRAGHEVVITSTDPDRTRAVADELAATAGSSNADAVRDADLVVLAVPYHAVAAVADEVADGLAGKPVIDATNPLAADGSGLAVTDRSGAEAVQEALPGAFVVKAFNTVFAANQADPVVDGTQLDGFFAGDDDAAKAVVAQFLSAAGYRPVDAGDLAAARALEHMAFLNIALNARNGWAWRSGWKLVGPTG
jgi:hypothetical protein